MELELVTIGDELLLGFTLDRNAATMARTLASVGVRVARSTTVGDRGPDIASAVADGLRRTGFVVTTGGLGPTRDDITKAAVAALFDVPLELDPGLVAALEHRFRKRGIEPMPVANRSQAEVPRGAVVLPNGVGTAPGLWLEGAPGTVVMLPGVPHEMVHLLETQVLPRLGSDAGAVTRSLVLRTTGVAESVLADRLSGFADQLGDVSLAFLPGVEGVDLRLTAWNTEAGDAVRRLEWAADLLVPDLGDHYYGRDDTNLAAVVLSDLQRRGWTTAVAESCTGGLIGQRLTAVPGSSAVFLGGVISYSNSVKTQQLGVSAGTLERHGAVSRDVAVEMAAGASRLLGADTAIAATGVAGPDGGSAEKPVGTVWVAVRVGERDNAAHHLLPGGRDEIRARTAQAGLALLRRELARAIPR